MAYQFQPIGPSQQGIASVLPVKLQQPGKLQTGTPQRVKKEPDSKKEIIGALLGGVMPSVARMGVSGLNSLLGDKAPNWLKLEEQDPRVPLEGFDDPSITADMTLPERETFEKRRELVRKLLPKYTPPTRPTALGRFTEGALTYAPSLALGEDGADTFIKSAQASTGLSDRRDDSVLKAALARLDERGKAMGNLPKGKRSVFEGAVVLEGNNKPTQVSRTGIVYEDGRSYVLSQGDKDIDLDTNGEFIESGSYYQKPSLTASLREKTREPATSLGTFINAETGVDANAFLRTVYDKDGLPSTEIFLKRMREKEDGSYVTEEIALNDLSRDPAEQNFDEFGGSNWQKYQYRYDLAPPPKDEKEAVRERWQALREYEYSAEQLASFVLKARKIPDVAFTNTAEFIKSLDSLGADFDAFVGTLGGQSVKDAVSTSFTKKDDDPDGLGSPAAIRMYGNLQKYLDAQKTLLPNDPRLVTAQNQFIRALEIYEEATDDSGLKANLLNIGDEITEVASNRVILKALQIQMAYMAAATAGQTGRTLSDKDLAFFLTAIGFGESSNAKVVKRGMASFIGDMVMTQPTRDTFTREFIRSPEAVNNYLRDELRVSGSMLNKIENSKTSPEERKILVSRVNAEIQDKIGNTRFIRFDPTTNRFKYFGLFEQGDLEYLPEFTREGGILDQEKILFRPRDLLGEDSFNKEREDSIPPIITINRGPATPDEFE